MDGSTASELLQKWTSAIKNGDPKQVTKLYDENGILLGTFSPKERVGHELILEYFESLLKSPVEVQIVSEHPHVFESAVVNSGFYNFNLGLSGLIGGMALTLALAAGETTQEDFAEWLKKACAVSGPA